MFHSEDLLCTFLLVIPDKSKSSGLIVLSDDVCSLYWPVLFKVLAQFLIGLLFPQSLDVDGSAIVFVLLSLPLILTLHVELNFNLFAEHSVTSRCNCIGDVRGMTCDCDIATTVEFPVLISVEADLVDRSELSEVFTQ